MPKPRTAYVEHVSDSVNFVYLEVRLLRDQLAPHVEFRRTPDLVALAESIAAAVDPETGHARFHHRNK